MKFITNGRDGRPIATIEFPLPTSTAMGYGYDEIAFDQRDMSVLAAMPPEQLHTLITALAARACRRPTAGGPG